MPRNPAPAKQKKKPNPKPKPIEESALEPGEERFLKAQEEPKLIEEQPPALEPGEERAVPKVEEEPPEPEPNPDPSKFDPTRQEHAEAVARHEANVFEKEPPAPPVQVIERRIETVTVEIPLGEPPHRFDQVHIEGWLRQDAAHTFARLRQALRDQGAKTQNGREVRTNPDILRWLMEQFTSFGVDETDANNSPTAIPPCT